MKKNNFIMYFFEVCDIEGCEHRIIPKLYFFVSTVSCITCAFSVSFPFSPKSLLCRVYKNVYCPILNSHRLLWMLITITDSVDDVKPCGEAALPLPRVGGELGG